MGGIKNKLNKLSNKLIKGSLSLKKKGGGCPAAFRVGTPLAGQRCDDTVARRATERSSNKANPLGSPTRSAASTAPPDPRFIKREASMNLLGYIIYMLSQPDGNAKLTIQISQLNWSMSRV